MNLEQQLRASVAYVAEKKQQEKRMSEAIVKAENGNGRDYGVLIERVVIEGDLSQLKPAERAEYYTKVCESIGVNPLTRPFAYIKTKEGAIKLYALRDCGDQLRKKHRINIHITERDTTDEVYVVTAKAMTPDGREDESTGAVSIKGLTGENLANALMKAETKAKRRVTLSICGLGWLDETEVETIPQWQTQLPRISPHGEPDDGVVYRTPEEADIIIRALTETETLEQLKSVWRDAGMATVDGYEAYHPSERKRISTLYKKLERQFSKPAKELDQAAAAAAASEDDL